MSVIATPAGAVQSKRSFTEVWVITIGHSLTHWYPATFYVLLPLIGRELGLSYGEIGSIVTAQAIAGAISNIPSGMLADSITRKGMLLATSLFWVGFPYMLMGVAHAYWMLAACAVLIGIGNNLWHPTAIPALARRFPERKGLAVSIHAMGGNVGDAVAPFVAGLMLQAISWRGVMMINIIPGIIMSVALLIFLRRMSYEGKAKAEGKQVTLGQTFKNFGILLQNRTVMMLSASSAFRAMTQSSLLAFLPLYLANTMHYQIRVVGFCMMALQLAGFVAAPIAGHLSDSMGRRNIIFTSMAMTAVVLMFMLFAGQSIFFVGLIAVLGFFLFAVRAVMQAWSLDATPKHMGGSAIGMLFGIQALGQAIGPLCCGLLADSYGLMATFYFMAGSIVLANFFIFFVPSEAPKAAKA
ncbi:MAG TPA: MFS transporter [Stellaceae bacterium]|nr:MFS transporter [Stellaceae bacterium]